MGRNILFSSKTFDVEVQDNLGNVLVTYVNVPGNSQDDAERMVRSKLITSSKLSGSQGSYRPNFTHPLERASDNVIAETVPGVA